MTAPMSRRIDAVAAASLALTVAGMVATPLVARGGPARRVLSTVVVTALATGTGARTIRTWGPARGLGTGAAVTAATAVVERAGTRTGRPFGRYEYTAALRPKVAGVPAIVPLAWFAMAVPARETAHGALGDRSTPVRRIVLGSAALVAWDLFLDPQMVDAGHWTWAHPDPGLPLVPGVPLTNYGGWLVVSVVMVGVLDRLLPRHSGPSGPAAALYLWTYGSSVLAHVVFFGRPGSALVGGLLMGALALPFARAVWMSAGRAQSE
jgi:uncharacterized membrane protein